MKIDWRHPARNLPRWLRGPIVSSLFHTLFTLIHFVPVGIWYWLRTGNPWPWLILSTAVWAWYWVREYRATGLRPKAVGTWLQRHDTHLDVLLPTVGLVWLYWLLLGAS